MTAIDADSNVTNALKEIVDAGYTAVGRYYSSNSRKKLTAREAQAISAAGLQIFVVFEDSAKPALTAAAGIRDAKIALQQAGAANQPIGTAIYFALDSELGSDHLDGVRTYFSGVQSVIGDAYKLGVYADGLVCQSLLSEGICQYAWLSASRGFPGSLSFYRSRRWSIAQDPNIDQHFHGLSIDTNEILGDFGSFRVSDALATAPAMTRAQVSGAAAESMPWMDWMRSRRGEIQQTGAKPTAFTEDIFSHTDYGPLNGFTPASCAATVCAALETAGYKSTRSALAASYIHYGMPCELKSGCIIVFRWSNGEHHVDFCDRIIDSATVRGLGGNQGHSLQDSDYSRKFIVATRWPVQAQTGQPQSIPRISVASARMTAQALDVSTFKLGKRHARHDPRVPMLAKYLPVESLPPPPPRVDWYSKIAEWGVMKNDTLSDCTCAAVAHVILQWTTYASPDPSEGRLLSDEDVVDLYEVVGGYNPADETTDQGAVEVDVLNYWLNEGVYGDQLAGYASLEVGNITEIKDAINWFGNVYVGLLLPVTAQTQTVWSVAPGGVNGPGAPGSWGGHAVPVVGYDERGLICVTWGTLKRMTYEFWSAYCDEAYALLSIDFVKAAGTSTPATSPGGLTWEELQADMQALKAGYVSAKMIRHI